MKKGYSLCLASLLFAGATLQAQSITSSQMDERFNDDKMPYGWFAEGWVVKDNVAKKKGGPDMTELFANTYLQLFTNIMQMIPYNSDEWGL